MRYGRNEPQQQPAAVLRACDCPEVDGRVRHKRETCTDPVVSHLGWYADDASDPS